MGLSDGTARSFPAFNQADLVLAILQAYYGNNYNPRLLTEDDFEITSYLVNYNQQWSELNLSSNDISLSTYKAIRLELGETPNSGYYNIKVYGEKDGKEQSSAVSSQTTTLQFNRNTLGTKSRRITLQYMKTGTSTLNVKKAYLIKNDGTEIESRLSPFWGCTMEPQSSKKPSGIVTTTTNTKKDGAIYNLSGQRVTNPVRGIYIKDGKKYYVR